MSNAFANSRFSRIRVPVRRVLALDGGSRRLKLLLAESDFGRFRILREEMLDLQAEGLVSSQEVKSHLSAVLETWGTPPLAVVLPSHLSISQVVDVPASPEREVDKFIAEETLKLGGVSESRIIYDFVRAQSPDDNRERFWVTLAQEGNIRERLVWLGLEHEEICEVSSTDNALIAAYQSAAGASSRAILVEMGAQSTAVIGVVKGQGAFASNFQMGGDFFTRAIARLRNCSEENAEPLKREKNLLSGPDALPEFAAVVDGWVAELKRQLSEWFQQNPGVSRDNPPFDLIASGGGFDQPGLLDYLKNVAGLPFQNWPRPPQADDTMPAKGFEPAFGAALEALGHSAQAVSLLPEDYRVVWRKRLSRQRIEWASAALVCLCILVLAFGTWRKLSLIQNKSRLLDKVQAGQRAVDENDALTVTLVSEYENLRPVLSAQQNTLDMLRMLALLQQSRSNRNLWYVLVADQQSYFSQPPTLLLTNRPARTNSSGVALDPTRSIPLQARTALPQLTNGVPVKAGVIAELCVPGDAETSRHVISEVVNNLKKQPLFSKADLLSDDLRRNLADPKVTIPDRDFVLALDFSVVDFQQPVILKKPPLGSHLRRTGRPPWGTPETGSGMTETSP